MNRWLVATARWGILTVVGGLGFFNIYSASAQGLYPYDYLLASPRINLMTEPSASVPVVVPIKNTGSIPWDGGQLQLGTVYSTGDKNRPSVWKTVDWASATRVGLNPPQWVNPNQIAEFRFTMQVPKYVGQYREYFQPVLGDKWLIGEPIVIQIQVGAEMTVQSVEEPKEVKIYRASQQADWLENGYIVATLPISTGKTGYATPSGKYRVYNRFEEAYSAKYKLYMGNWLGIAKEGVGPRGYGMHSLAYWKIAKQPYPDGTIKNGRLYINHRVYEDVLHLGKPMSHGCLRFGIDEAKVLYGWAPENTLVTVI